MLGWGLSVSTMMLYHATFLVNSVGHMSGRRRQATRRRRPDPTRQGGGNGYSLARPSEYHFKAAAMSLKPRRTSQPNRRTTNGVSNPVNTSVVT